MRLVLGLGNPGEAYAATRHNVAWRVLDALAERARADEGPRHRLYRVRTTRLGGQPGALLQPLTFMNRSGAALEAWWAEHPGVPEDLLVVSDDVYLPVGTLRLRASGSSGGHRGLESLEAAVGHREFARLRIGVGAAADTAALREHVLEMFASEEEPAVAEAVARAADAVEMWAARGIVAAMNAFNQRTAQEGSTS